MKAQAGPRERPTIMGAASVKAILKDEHPKTQTRRVMQVQPPAGALRFDPWLDHMTDEWQYERGRPLWASTEADGTRRRYGCPYGKPGDRLWCREALAVGSMPNLATAIFGVDLPAITVATYAADGAPVRDENGFEIVPWWRGKALSPMYMPRWASRLALEIVEVRVERLQDISYDDCCRELGAPLVWPGPGPEPYHRQMHNAFASHWDVLNGGKRGLGWETNCWVWVVAFRRLAGGE